MYTPSAARALLFTLLCAVAAPHPASAQAAPAARLRRAKAAAERIKADDILRDVSYLASDANMGRRTPFPGSPSPGYDSAAHYVAKVLRDAGVKPMGDNGTYFQHYTVTRSTLDTSKVAGAIGNEPLTWGSDFLINSFLVPGVRDANVIYVGTGIRLLKRGVDPYAGFDIKGKWLLVSGGTPQTGRGAFRAGMPAGKVGVDYLTITEVARFGGALGIITVSSDSVRANWSRRAVTGQDLNPSLGVAYAQYQVPSISISTATLSKLLAGTSLSPETVLSRDSTLVRPSLDLGADRRLRIDFAATTLDARPYNVVGMLEGSDSKLKNEWVSLAAHLDGAVPANGSVPGNALPDQYNAADDNASGSAGNLAVVRALVAAPRPKRSILLIWDSGEEVGLWGTRAIAYGPWSEKIVLHVSNDMIGRSRPNNSPKELTLSSADSIYVTGPLLLSTRIEAALQQAAKEFPFIALDRRYEDVSASYYYPRTDAGPYLERGIPIMQFFNGEHADYHRPTDDVAKLDIRKITNVSKLSFGALWLAADDASPLAWDGIVPETLWWVKPQRPTPPATPARAPRKAVFILLDGIPADVIERVPTPALDAIAAIGGYARAYVGGTLGGLTETPTISAPGYMSLLTGTWANKHNVRGNSNQSPNYAYWNLFRIVESVEPSRQTALFSTWLDNRTVLVGEGRPDAGNVMLDHHVDGFELDTVAFPHDKASQYIRAIDDRVTAEAAAYIAQRGPDLSWVYLQHTDDMGHAHGDSDPFFTAVQEADARVGRIWAAVQQRQALGEQWMIVVTTDHGRDARTGKGHGAQSARERTTWIVTNQSALTTRFTSGASAIVDIAPSMLQYLGISVPPAVAREWEGVSFLRAGAREEP